MGFGEPRLVSARSALPRVAGFTVVRSDAVLLAALLSPLVETLAVLVTEGTAAAATLTVRVIVLLPFAPMGPAFVQVTTCTAAVQLHPVPTPDTNPNPAGSVSETVIAPVVGPVPLLVTVRV